MAPLQRIIFYNIDKAIKSYRQMAQRNISGHGISITIDQWLLLKALQQNPDATQQQIAESIFKDYASVTRMIELLVKHGMLNREVLQQDRRRSRLSLTDNGIATLSDMEPIINANRQQALRGISPDEIELLRTALTKIADNCQQ